MKKNWAKYILNAAALLVCSFFILGASGSQKDKTPPSRVTVTYQSTADSVSLFWTESTDPSGISGYTVYRDGMDLGAASSTGYVDTGLQEYTSYTYTIVIRDNAGNLTDETVTAVTADLNPPTAPGELTYTATANSITLSWAASTDTGGMSGYRVYLDGGYLAFTPSTTYTFEGLKEYTDYALKVAAVDRADKATPSEIEAKTADATPPTAPANLSYTATADSVSLSWDASADAGVGMGTYEIYRNDENVGTVSATGFTDTGLTGNTDYTYTVKAYDRNGNGPSEAGIDVHTYDDTIKALSFNILFKVDSPDITDPNNSSAVRVPKVKEYLSQYLPDVIGFQEADAYWYDVLSASMTDYASVGGTNENENYECPIFYRKEKYDLVGSGTEWLGKAYGEPLDNNQNWFRVCTWAVLRDKVTQKEFIAVNTHLDDGIINSDADRIAVTALRKKEAGEVLAKIGELRKTYPVPVLCTGDFNETSAVSDGAYRAMTSGILQDSCAAAATTVNTGITYHGNITVRSNQSFKGLPIDYCFVNGFDVLSYTVTRDSYRLGNGRLSYPSDHFGVLVMLKPQ